MHSSKGLSGKHMAGSLAGESGSPAEGAPHFGFLEQPPRGRLEPKLHPSTPNLDDSLIIISFRVFPALRCFVSLFIALV